MVASALLIASNGRLSPFAPLADDHGIDLIVLDKVTRRTLAIQVKSAIASPSRGTLCRHLREGFSGLDVDRFDARNFCKTTDDDIAIQRIKLDSIATTTGALGSN